MGPGPMRATSHSRAGENILAGFSKHFCRAPLRRKFLNFYFSNWCILVILFLSAGRALKRPGVWGSLPPTPPSRRAWLGPLGPPCLRH